jgi:hypothetical protein
MKQYAAWQAPFYSFWSKSFYSDVAKNWHGLAYGYLFAVICFTWIFIAVKKQIDFAYIADHDFYPLAEQMPKTTIDKGIISIDKPCPYTMTNGQGRAIITFDTREKPIELKDVPGNFLVAKDGIYFKNTDVAYSERKTSKDEKLDLSTIDHQIIDSTAAKQFISLAFIFCALQTLLYALIGRIVSKLSKVCLSYGTLIRIAAVALTPALLIDSILKVRGLDVNLLPIWPILAFLISVGYIIFAISANTVKQDNKPELSNS